MEFINGPDRRKRKYLNYKFQFVRVVDGAGAIIQKPFWPGAGSVKQRTARGDPKMPQRDCLTYRPTDGLTTEQKSGF